MNVMPAWRRCINGKGIIVGVVDLGIDDHEDLPIVSIYKLLKYFSAVPI